MDALFYSEAFQFLFRSDGGDCGRISLKQSALTVDGIIRV